MKTVKLFLIGAAIAAIAAACGTKQADTPNSTANAPKNTAVNATPAATATPDELAAVKKIYTDKCAGCHKDTGTGGEKEIDGVKIKVPDFTSEKLKAEEDKGFIDAITNGYKEDGMPAFKGKISDEDIKNLVKLIRRDFQKK